MTFEIQTLTASGKCYVGIGTILKGNGNGKSDLILIAPDARALEETIQANFPGLDFAAARFLKIAIFKTK